MQSKLLAKIEELTLHMIDSEKRTETGETGDGREVSGNVGRTCSKGE